MVAGARARVGGGSCPGTRTPTRREYISSYSRTAPPHLEEFRIIVHGELRRRETGNEFLQLLFTIKRARMRGKQSARLPTGTFLFCLEPPEEVLRRVWVVTGANQVLSRKTVCPLLLRTAGSSVGQGRRPAAARSDGDSHWPPKDHCWHQGNQLKKIPPRRACPPIAGVLVRDFVGQDGSQLRLVFRQADHAGIDHNVSTRKRLRINFRVVEDVKGEDLLTPAAMRQVLTQSVNILIQGIVTPGYA